MDIAKLKQIIGDNLKNGVLDLNTAKLESPGITAIATDYLPEAVLKLSDAQITSSDSTSITVGGKGTAIPFTGMTIAAKFYLVDTNAALTMTATGTKDWTLNKAVPAFDDTLGAGVRFADTPAPPTLSLLSDPDGGKPQGLTFAGTIDFAAMSAGISTLLGIKTEALQGPMQLKKGGTEFTSINFAGPEIKEVNLWLAKNCTVGFGMTSEVIADPAIKTVAAIPNIGLTTVVPFTASGNTYELPLSVQVTDLDSFIRLSADITGLINASLDALGSFAGGADLKKTIPSTFHIEEYVRFTSLFVDFDVKGTSVEMMGLQVNSTKPWPIVTVASTGKTFNAENIVLNFNVLKPFGGSAKPSVYLGGEITLTERASLYVSAGYPNFEIQGYLTEKSVLSIREFVENFVGDASGVPELLYVDSLGFDLQSGDYSFEISIDGYWPVNGEQDLSLIVQQLGFAVHYTQEEKTASFNGCVRVGTVDIYVTADYSSSNGKSGWIFTGKTGLGQRIPIGEFVTYLTDTFNAGKPPSWIEGITLQDLSVTVNTLDKKYDFSVTGNIPIAANDEIHITVGFKMEALAEGGYKKILSGKLAIGKSEFDLVYTSTPSDSSILAEWKAVDESGYLQFEDIAHALGFDNAPKVPDGLNLVLKEAKLYYDFTKDKQSLVIAAASANYGNAIFTAKKIDGAWTYVFGIDMKIGVNLADLPLVGSSLSTSVGKIGLDSFKLLAATKLIKEEYVKEFNTLITDNAGADYPTLPVLPEGVEKGVYCALVLNLGTDNKFEMQISTAKKEAPKKELLLAAETPDKDDNAYWLELQKTLGPVYLDKAGVAYRDGRVALLLDASLIFTALKIDLIELGVSNPLSKIDPNFELTGLSVAYKSGPVNIAGGFLRQKSDKLTEYTGMAVIGIKAFNLSALGSYASLDGHPSMFIFAMLTAPPLGGPPVFFVTGVAAGFGYNRGLKLPSIDTVSKFPLVMGFVPNQESPFSGPDPGDALKILVKEKVVPVQIGQNWVAAGVQFTSFQLLQSFALLSVAFGTSLEIGVIGMSTVSVPPKSPIAVAYAQLAICVKLLPDQGIFSVEAKLTPASYLLSKSCVLTGGFAFYLWTAPNEHQGDFVVTLGGYHPNFKPPAHYPKVPRLGFNWTVTKELTIKGGMYFALTPSCIMAGGSLEATFSSGNFKAWFIIGADFLIAWKPYHYEAHLYLSFGVSYTFKLNLLFTTITTTISVSLGADLAIWGPDFSGTATIHLWIISFKISFGAAADKKAPPISWQEFRESFLPPSAKTAEHIALYGDALGAPIPTDTYCVGRVSKGMVEDLTVDKKNPKPISWIVNRNSTVLETNTVIPAKEYKVVIKDKNGTPVPDENLVYTNKSKLDARNKDFGVGMVEVDNASFNSTHNVTVVFEGVLNPKIKYEIFAIISNVPKSLWQNQEAAYDKDAVVKKVLTGFRITPLAPVPDQSVPIALENFQYHYQDYFMPIKPAAPVLVKGPDNIDGMKRLKETIDTDPAKKMRSDIIESLIRRGIPVNAIVNVKQIAEKAEDFIMAPPVLQYTYWQKPL